MPLQLKHLGSDVVRYIYSFDDTYRQYYTNAVVPLISGFVVAYCQGCRRWLDGNSDDDSDDWSYYSRSPVGTPDEESVGIRFHDHMSKSKRYTNDALPTFYNVQTTYCHNCEGWIISRKY